MQSLNLAYANLSHRLTFHISPRICTRRRGGGGPLRASAGSPAERDISSHVSARSSQSPIAMSDAPAAPATAEMAGRMGPYLGKRSATASALAMGAEPMSSRFRRRYKYSCSLRRSACACVHVHVHVYFSCISCGALRFPLFRELHVQGGGYQQARSYQRATSHIFT